MSFELFATKVLNITEDELKALVYEGETGKETLKADADDLLINKYGEKVTRIKTEKETAFNDGWKKANKELDQKYRKAIKEHLEFESEKEDLTEVFTDLKETIKAKSKPSPLKDEEIKNHPTFREREKELNKIIEQQKIEFEEKEKSILTTYQKKENSNKFKTFMKSKALEIGIILPESPEIQASQMDAFLRQFDEFEYDYTDESNPLILKDGARLEDKLGNPLKHDDFAVSKIKGFFPIKVQDPKGSAGNGQDGGAGGSSSFTFKDVADYRSQRALEPDRTKRLEMDAAWTASQK